MGTHLGAVGQCSLTKLQDMRFKQALSCQIPTCPGVTASLAAMEVMVGS